MVWKDAGYTGYNYMWEQRGNAEPEDIKNALFICVYCGDSTT